MINKIQKALKNAQIEAVLLTSEQNRRYATGFPSSAGVCYISQQGAYFFTDFRYIEAARAQIQGFIVREIDGESSYAQAVNACIQEEAVGTIALEDASLTYADFQRWSINLQAKVIAMGDFMNHLRMVKTTEELENIVRAQRIAERAFSETLNDIHSGATEKQIAAKLTYLMLLYGAEQMSFDPIVVSGVHSSKPHGVPTDKKIADGEFVTMDFGCIYQGYCSDMTRTVALGFCTDKMLEVYDTVLRAQEAGIAVARAGVTGRDVDGAARRLIEQAGYGNAFGHGFGHGVGLDIHEAPNASPRAKTTLPDGAVLTAEPGIYLPEEFGVRIEDMLYLEKNGCRNLTNASKSLLIL